MDVICLLRNGFGNQMFQYAAAYSVAKRLDRPLKLIDDTRWNGFHLHNFDMSIEMILPSSLGPNPFFVTEKCLLAKDVLPDDRPLVLNEFYESEIFFDEFKKDIISMFLIKALPFDVRTERLCKQIRGCRSVGVHVRHGKGMNDMTKWNVPISFQKKAMDVMKERLRHPVFFVFSDDIDYCREHLPAECMFVSTITNSFNNPVYDFFLLQQCKHFIVPWSTFSVWAAYTSKASAEKTVIAARVKDSWYLEFPYWDNPTREFKRDLYVRHAYPKDWIVMPFDE